MFSREERLKERNLRGGRMEEMLERKEVCRRRRSGIGRREEMQIFRREVIF